MQQTDFTDSFIKSMLGWIRWIASSVANLFQGGSGSSGGSMTMIAWFADNWIKILIALIVVGVLIDWLVWMARWRPYWVWFRKRRILLENDMDGIDEDDLMLHYGGEVSRRGGVEDDFDSELDDFNDIPTARRDDEDGDGEFDEDDAYADNSDNERDADEGHYWRDDRYADDEDPENADDEDPENADEGFDDLYGDERGRAAESGRLALLMETDEDDGAAEGDELPPRAPARKRGFFARGRKKTVDGDDPFRIEGDFFDDLNDAPTREASPLRTSISLERDAQDTSVYQRPILLPGDEPGAVRGADEDENEAWHSGYTLRSAERGRRRKRDAGA